MTPYFITSAPDLTLPRKAKVAPSSSMDDILNQEHNFERMALKYTSDTHATIVAACKVKILEILGRVADIWLDMQLTAVVEVSHAAVNACLKPKRSLCSQGLCVKGVSFHS